MKSKNITLLFMAIVAAVTVLGSLTQPTVFHQVAVWAGGIFSLVLIGMVFLVRNWPETATKPEKQKEQTVQGAAPELSPKFISAVHHLRGLGMSDEYIANGSGFTSEQIKEIK